MEQLRRRRLKTRKKIMKITLLIVSIALLVVAGIHYAGSATNGNQTVSKSKQALSDFTVSLINGGTI